MSTASNITRAEFEALVHAVEALAAQVDRDRQMREETHSKVSDLYRVLIEPEPGKTVGLLYRMAAVTIAAETGEAAAERIIRWAKIIGALSVIGTTAYTVIRFLQPWRLQ
jgi:hypothetical protein